MNLGEALEHLKAGKRVSREGWNGKGMWLVLVKPSANAHNYGDVAATFVWGLRVLPWIGMKTADACFVPWLASQTDLLAEDWSVVP